MHGVLSLLLNFLIRYMCKDYFGISPISASILQAGVIAACKNGGTIRVGYARLICDIVSESVFVFAEGWVYAAPWEPRRRSRARALARGGVRERCTNLQHHRASCCWQGKSSSSGKEDLRGNNIEICAFVRFTPVAFGRCSGRSTVIVGVFRSATCGRTLKNVRARTFCKRTYGTLTGVRTPVERKLFRTSTINIVNCNSS